MPCRAARPERGCTKPAWPSGIATARPVPTTSPAPPVRARRARRRRDRGRRRRRTRASGSDRVVAQALDRAARSRASAPLGVASATRYGAKRRISRRGRRATTSTPSARVLALLDRRAERVELVRACRPPRTGSSSRTRSKRSAKRSAIRARSSSSPSPVERRDLQRVGIAVREPAPAERVDGVDLVERRARRGSSSAPISCSTASTAAICSTSRCSGADASTTWRTRSATSVSSSVAAKPSTS